MKYIRLLAVPFVLFVAFVFFNASTTESQSQLTQGQLSFTPKEVKDGEQFSIRLTGGPANTTTKLWVKNGGGGFEDFGGWLSTDKNGDIDVTRTLDCGAYQTLEPGKTLPVGSKRLSQAVYVEYVGTNIISETAVHTKDCTTSGNSSPVLPPVGTDRCYFYEPYGGTYHFMKYPQPDSYDGTVMNEVVGEKGDSIPVTSFTLKWASVREKGNYKNDPITDSGYSAVLTSDYSDGNIKKVNENVDIAGSFKTEIGDKDINYKLELRKNGNTVATCSVKAHQNVIWRKQYKAPTPGKVSFPDETAYNITTSKGIREAKYKFADPIKNITFNQTNLATYLGNHNKNIFWIGTRYGGGPLGRWDINDPWNPEGPETLGMIYGGSALALGKKQPGEHRGPFSSGAWPHPPSLGFGNGVFGETNSGEARFAFASGEEGGDGKGREPRAVTPVVTLAPGQGMNWGQLIDGKWQDLFSGGVLAIDVTASNNFFFFGAGGRAGNSYTSGATNPLTVFNLTNLTGSIEPGDSLLNSFASQSWQNLTDIEIVEVPGVRNHFVVARSSTRNKAEKPRFYIGEIDADTGRMVRQNSFLLDLQGVSYTAPYSPIVQPYTGSNLESVSVGNKSYVFMTESFVRNGLYDQSYGTLKIAAFEFNPATLTLSRKGDMSFASIPTNYSADPDLWNLVKTDDGSSYPLLMVSENGKTYTFTDSYNQTRTNVLTFDTKFYSLKDKLTATTTFSVTAPTADLILPGDIVKRPLTMGQIILKGLDSSSSGVKDGGLYNAFLKKENGKTNLYMYRQAFMFDGRQAGDPVMPYHEFATEGTEVHWNGLNNNLGSSFRGVASLRIDKIDVSDWTGPASDVIPPVVPPTGTTTPPIPNPDPGIFHKECSELYPGDNAMISLCEQINQIQARSCAVAPYLPFCKSNLPK